MGVLGMYVFLEKDCFACCRKGAPFVVVRYLEDRGTPWYVSGDQMEEMPDSASSQCLRHLNLSEHLEYPSMYVVRNKIKSNEAMTYMSGVGNKFNRLWQFVLAHHVGINENNPSTRSLQSPLGPSCQFYPWNGCTWWTTFRHLCIPLSFSCTARCAFSDAGMILDLARVLWHNLPFIRHARGSTIIISVANASSGSINFEQQQRSIKPS